MENEDISTDGVWEIFLYLITDGFVIPHELIWTTDIHTDTGWSTPEHTPSSWTNAESEPITWYDNRR
jgi:hypothetical protein